MFRDDQGGPTGQVQAFEQVNLFVALANSGLGRCSIGMSQPETNRFPADAAPARAD